MKKNVFMAVSLMGGLMLFASACVKEKTDDEKLRPVGSEIIFSAATSYENDDRTRTVYTGKDQSGQDVTTSSTIERIDWENNDRVSIVYTTGSSQSEYKVTNVLTSNNENDLADVVATGTKLTWASGDNHVFYAMYPTANGNHANSAASLSGTTVSGTIPASQSLGTSNNTQNHPKYLPDMKYAYMVGYANNTCIDGSRVTIPFTPAVTAFNFIFKAASAVTVTGFEMTTTESGNVGTDLTGNFSFNISGPKMRNSRVVGAEWDTVTKTSTGKTITVNFGSDISLTANQYLDFTVFTLPIAQTGITIKFHLKNVTNGVTTNYTKTLDLKDGASTWHTFAAGKKHVVTNDKLEGDTVTYVFEQTTTTQASPLAFGVGGETKSFTVRSYKQIGTGANAKQIPVSWTVDKYSINNGSSWTNKPAWVTSVAAGTNPSAVSASYSAVLAASPRAPLGSNTALGSDSAPYDLATKSTTHGGTSMNTANCYVVSAPGYYCFPLVYGNAIKGGSTNTTAFYNNKNITNYLARLVDHNNTGITQPYVDKAYTVSSVELLWQDYKNLITNVSLFDVTVSGTKYKYVKFYVAPHTIIPGNAVIAVKNSGGTVLWSWHIWVTSSANSSTVTVRSKSFMKAILGWRDAGTGYTIAARDVWVRLKQAESNNTVIVYLHQNDATSPTLYNTAPHYQWGRKDPFVPPKGLGQNGNETVYNAGGTSIDGFSIVDGKTSLSNAIQNPTTMWTPTNESGVVDWLNRSSGYMNLWNHTQTATVDSWTNSNTVVHQSPANHGKTVYDPCPAGYTVPNGHDYENFQFTADVFCKGNSYSHSFANLGWTINSTFWPVLGHRSRLHNAVSFTGESHNNLGSYGYYQTSVAHGAGNVKNCLYIELNSTNIHITQGAKSAAQSVRCVAE